MYKAFFLILGMTFVITSCDWGTNVVNKISGHEQNCCDDEDSDSKMVYHEESRQVK